jgi:glycosyltransferase involved in cell wall biosynthesis
MKPRVLHVAETLPGGIATVMRLLMLDQTRRYGAKRVMALIPQRYSHFLLVNDSQKHTYFRSGRNFLALLQLGWELAMLVWRTRPDIVHLHSTFAGAIGRPVLFTLRPWRKTKVVYCPHAFAFLMDESPFQKSLFAFAEYLLAAITHAIICVSHDEKKMAEYFGLSPHNLQVIQNGIEPSSRKAKNLFTLPEDVLNVIFVGRFDYQKGFDLLQKVMAKLQGQPIHLTAVGAPVLGYKYPEKAPNITYTGWLEPQYVEALMGKADVLAMPSRYEGFGLVLVEAMSQGMPAIASDIGPLREVGQGSAVFLKPENTNAWVKALQTTPLATWRKLGKTGKEIYQRQFMAARMCRETAALYAKLLQK